MSKDDNECHDLGYDLVLDLIGSQVRVYMCNGAVLSGLLTECRGKYILVRNDQREAIINLDHVTSTTRM